jgi:hypothetical protein
VSSPSATEEAGAVDREIESRQGMEKHRNWRGLKKLFAQKPLPCQIKKQSICDKDFNTKALLTLSL